jgi:iron complex transport system permease protein
MEMKLMISQKGIIKNKNYGSRTLMVLTAGGIALLLLMLFAITQGAASLSFGTVLDAFFHFDMNDSAHLLVRDMRLPRVIGGALVGSALAVSGAVMQGMTRNPLADSGLMGLSSGAGLALAICFVFFPSTSYSQIVLATFLGAALGAGCVYGISSLVPGGSQPMKLVLAGAAVSALLSAISQGLAISFRLSQNMTFWTMGSIAGTSWKQIAITAPIILLALAGAMILSRQISILSMGEDVAKGLGVKLEVVKVIGTFLVVLLAGTSVAVAGSISFVGILIPHFCRFLVGSDYRKIIPVGAVLGAALVVLADLLAKTVSAPAELPVGALISMVGVPAFLYIVRKRKKGL